MSSFWTAAGHQWGERLDVKQVCYSAGPPNTMLQLEFLEALKLEFLDALKNNNKLAALALHAAFSRPPSSTSTRAKGRYRERALIAYEGTAFPAQYIITRHLQQNRNQCKL